MRRYHLERKIIRRHHREHLLGQLTEPQAQPAELPRGCFRKRHAPPLHPAAGLVPRSRQEWQAERALREGVQEIVQERLSQG
jgi:hypothetical protein